VIRAFILAALFATLTASAAAAQTCPTGVNCGTLTGLALPAAVTDLLGDAGLCSP